MASQKHAEKQRRQGWIALALWAVLIVAGIISKRVYGHPDWMVFFHLPAAVFLVMAFHKLSSEVRARYRESVITFSKGSQVPDIL